MNRHLSLWLSGLMLALTLSPFAAESEAADQGRGLPLDRAFPPVTVVGLNQAKIDLATLKGKALVVVSARDDNRSRKIIEALANLFKDSPALNENAQTLVIWSSPVDEKLAEPITKLAHAGLPFAAAFDPDGTAWDAMETLATPTVNVLDKDGILRYKVSGVPQDFTKRMALAFGEKLNIEIAMKSGGSTTQTAPHTMGASRHITLARILLGQGRLDSALNTLTNARKTYPDDAELNSLYGFVLLKKGETAEATTTFEAVLASHPEHVEARVGQAACQIADGKLDTARKTLDALDKSSHNTARVQFYLGQLAEKQGDLKTALSRYKAALQMAVPEL